jgi:hypothetical protein
LKPVIWAGSLASIGSVTLQASAEPDRIDLVMRSELDRREIGLTLMREDDLVAFEHAIEAVLRASKRRRRRRG